MSKMNGRRMKYKCRNCGTRLVAKKIQSSSTNVYKDASYLTWECPNCQYSEKSDITEVYLRDVSTWSKLVDKEERLKERIK